MAADQAPPATRRRDTRIAAIGGGHGLARTLEALGQLDVQPDAIVTVADDGGSSGKLRSEHQIMALGDMRMALETLAPAGALQAVFGHRFSDGQLDGHAVGNLVLLGLLERAGGDIAQAVLEAAQMLACAGRVHPCTASAITLVGRVNGRVVRGQVALANTQGTFEDLWTDPPAVTACTGACQAVETADLVLLGPGSLFTSVIPNLLVPDLARAVADAEAPLVYLANIAEQPGETAGMSLQDHVEALLSYIPGRRSITVVAHAGPSVESQGTGLVATLDHERVERLVVRDLAARRGDGTVVAAHDAGRLAAALMDVAPLLARSSA